MVYVDCDCKRLFKTNLCKMILWISCNRFMLVPSRGPNSLSTCRVKFVSTATKHWSGYKCSDVPAKIQTRVTPMDHRDWPGTKQWWAERQACFAALAWQRNFSQQSSLFEGLCLSLYISLFMYPRRQISVSHQRQNTGQDINASDDPCGQNPKLELRDGSSGLAG